MDARLSVAFVVTVYNKKQFLPHVLAGVAAERDDVGGEIIIVDDGSTDGSGEFLEAFCAGRSECRLIRQRNSGPHAALTAGMLAAAAPYLRLIDGDDIPVCGSTRLMIDALQRSGAALVAGQKETYELGALDPDRLRPVDMGRQHSFAIDADALRGAIRKNDIVPSVMLMTREIGRSVLPIPATAYHCHDFYLVTEIAQRAPIARLGTTVCYFAAAAEGRVSASVSGMYHDTALVAREHMRGAAAWPGRHRRFAVRRNAGRAYLFGRRHHTATPLRLLCLSLIRLLGYLPLYQFFPAALTYVAATYPSALAARRPAAGPPNSMPEESDEGTSAVLPT